jgi:hypothetical protein
MRALTLVAVLVALLGGAACDDPLGTTTPTRTTLIPPAPPPQPLPPPPPTQPAAVSVLEISHLKVIENPPEPPWRQSYGYVVTFWLTEVTGLSGATIVDVVVSTTGQSQGSCWGDVLRVEPGGTLDYFERALRSLSYCAPSVGSPVRATYVAIEVTYADDDGRIGTVKGWVTLTK